MLKPVNKVLKHFGFQIYGNGFVEKASRTSFKNDPYEVQKDLIKKSSPIIFDIGAHYGETANKYFRSFKSPIIHSFEPFPNAYKKLVANVKNENFYSNQLAVTDKSEKAILHINVYDDTNSLLESQKINATSDKYCKTIDQINVKTISLDEYCMTNNVGKIDILKIDVQGSELIVLKGAEGLLKKNNITLIFTECYFSRQYVNQPLFHDLSSYLIEFDYVLADLYNLYYNTRQILWGDAIFVYKSYL